MAPSGTRRVLNDALSIYFADATMASAFVARCWCVGAKVETPVTRWVWKRSHGRASEAPPNERGGNRYVRPTATAPHLDSTLLNRFGPQFSNGRYRRSSGRSDCCRRAVLPCARMARFAPGSHTRAAGRVALESVCDLPAFEIKRRFNTTPCAWPQACLSNFCKQSHWRNLAANSGPSTVIRFSSVTFATPIRCSHSAASKGDGEYGTTAVTTGGATP